MKKGLLILLLCIMVTGIGCATFESTITAMKSGLDFVHKTGLIAIEAAEDVYNVYKKTPVLGDLGS